MLKRKHFGKWVGLLAITTFVFLGIQWRYFSGKGAVMATPPASSTLAQVPTNINDKISQIVSQPRYAHSTWGYSFTDLATGEILLEQNSERMFVTGSIIKSYSTATALADYGPDYRFRTPVYRTGAVNNGILDGNLILVAAGDFSFGLREQPDGTLVYNSFPEIDHNYADTGLPGAVAIANDPLRVLQSLATQIKAAGIQEVRGNVVIDDRLFESYKGWPDGLIAPIWVNENVLDITVIPTGPGQPATIDWRPKTAAYKVESTVKTVAQGQETEIKTALVAPGVVQISGQIAANAQPTLQIWQIPNPAEFARTVLIEALNAAGVKVNAQAVSQNPVNLLPASASYPENQKVAEHVSPPLSEFTKVILKVSYNRGADLMACLVAVKAGSRNCEAGIAPIMKTITALGVSKDGTFMFDGAGSDERDRTTPIDLSRFFQQVSKQPYGTAFRNGLAILGVDGTVATNQKGTPAAGNIQQKGGTRAGVTPDGRGLLTALTEGGYINTKSGRQLTFAIMLRDVPFATPEDIFAASKDQGAIAAIVQQGF